VTDGVLPGGEALAVVREPGGDEVADAAEREALPGSLEDGHRDEGDVRVRRLDERTATRHCSRRRRSWLRVPADTTVRRHRRRRLQGTRLGVNLGSGLVTRRPIYVGGERSR